MSSSSIHWFDKINDVYNKLKVDLFGSSQMAQYDSSGNEKGVPENPTSVAQYDSDGNSQVFSPGGQSLSTVRSDNVPRPRKITGVDATWPDDDTFSMLFPVDQDVRVYRVRAIKTAGSTAGAFVKAVQDAMGEITAGVILAISVTDANEDDQPYNEYFDGEWSEWIILSLDPDLPPLRRLDFLASADTWSIIVEAY